MIGRPGAAAAQALFDVLPHSIGWLEEATRALATKGVDAATEAMRTAVDGDEAFARVLYESQLRSWMAGQLMVRDVELADELPQASVREVDFFSMPFEDAVRIFTERQIVTPAQFDRLRDRFRQGAYVARGLASQRMVRVSRDLIEEMLRGGLTPTEAAQRLRDAESTEGLRLGVTPASSNYLDTVIRTNVATSYGYGRHAALQSPDVIALRPYVRFVTSGDERVRESHRALHGKVFRAGSPEATHYAPPIGFRCRCSMTSLSERQFQSRGYVLNEGRVDGVEPDEGWAGEPLPLTPNDL